MTWQSISLAAVVAVDTVTIGRALLRPHREPASRLAWIVAILALPIAGTLLYLLLGEVRLGSSEWERRRQIHGRIPRPAGNFEPSLEKTQEAHWAPFALARPVNRLPPTQGNTARLAPDSNAAISEMIADIDAARSSVHGCFYIWLADRNGLRLADAFMRAAQRGVRVRLLADGLGSRAFIRSGHWRKMRDSGCDVRVALPVGNLAWALIRERVDLRNHRKLLIVDNEVGWCGSQNCADPEFRIKARFAPWVDIMSRWEGPVAQHCQFLFACDWIAEGGDDISGYLAEQPPSSRGPILAQVLGTGPTAEFDAMPTCFSELIHSARAELVITTPYFVPDEQLLFALTSGARRGVRTTMVFPKRNDNWIVSAVSRSYYKDLLDAGIEIYEFVPGLLHAKTMVVDRQIGLIGSANLDRRSFELNFENDILFEDAPLAMAVRERQDQYLAQSDRVRNSDLRSYSVPRRLWQNLLATVSPVL